MTPSCDSDPETEVSVCPFAESCAWKSVSCAWAKCSKVLPASCVVWAASPSLPLSTSMLSEAESNWSLASWYSLPTFSVQAIASSSPFESSG